MTFEIIKSNFELGLWNEKQLKVALDKGAITQEEYDEILQDSSEKIKINAL